MKPFMDSDFLLSNETGRRLYHEVAEEMPIMDYHCHIDPQEIAEDRIFHNLTQLWLEGDHYKWRQMRWAGVDERYITGDADDFEKFEMWARTLEKAAGNPLYHWSHLELRRYFGYEGHLTGANAKQVWDFCNGVIGAGMSVRAILTSSNVTALCTTDDPADNLKWHEKIAEDPTLEVRVLPAFRPDRVVNLEKPEFSAYLKQLAETAHMDITDWAGLKTALTARLAFFADHGCVAADHGLLDLCYRPADDRTVDAVLKKRLAGEAVTEEERWQYITALMEFFGRAYCRLGWVMQLHFGARRDNNTRMFARLGPDSGYDCINSSLHLNDVAEYLDALERTDALPRTILYSLNPNDNAAIGTLLGCFQGGGMPGKLQHGSAWWFNDHKSGMSAQIVSLANLGLLGCFVGMLTDSRSFLSYVRHAYFRRIFCDLVGAWVENGELPDDDYALKALVADVSYRNCVRYFDMERYNLRGV